MKVAALLFQITDAKSVGLKNLQGLFTSEAFYWDRNDASRAFGKRFFDKIGLKSLGAAYRKFFNYISRHQHTDMPDVWEKRLAQAGFKIERWWHYFSPSALATLEWGHYFGLPSLILRKLVGRWMLAPYRWNLFHYNALKKHIDHPLHDSGAYTFYVTTKV